MDAKKKKKTEAACLPLLLTVPLPILNCVFVDLPLMHLLQLRRACKGLRDVLNMHCPSIVAWNKMIQLLEEEGHCSTFHHLADSFRTLLKTRDFDMGATLAAWFVRHYLPATVADVMNLADESMFYRVARLGMVYSGIFSKITGDDKTLWMLTGIWKINRYNRDWMLHALPDFSMYASMFTDDAEDVADRLSLWRRRVPVHVTLDSVSLGEIDWLQHAVMFVVSHGSNSIVKSVILLWKTKNSCRVDLFVLWAILGSIKAGLKDQAQELVNTLCPLGPCFWANICSPPDFRTQCLHAACLSNSPVMLEWVLSLDAWIGQLEKVSALNNWGATVAIMMKDNVDNFPDMRMTAEHWQLLFEHVLRPSGSDFLQQFEKACYYVSQHLDHITNSSRENWSACNYVCILEKLCQHDPTLYAASCTSMIHNVKYLARVHILSCCGDKSCCVCVPPVCDQN